MINLLGVGFHNLILFYKWFMVSHHQLVMVLINVHDSNMVINCESYDYINVHGSNMMTH
jgi:hypothetical protein